MSRLSEKLRFATFVLDEAASMPRRYAEILRYAKEHYPNDFIPKTILYKVANKRASAPPANGREVKNMSASLTRTKAILSEEFKEAMLSGSGGYRLAVDDEDRLRNAVPPARSRFERAGQVLDKVASLVDVSKVKSTPELDVLKRDFRQLTQAVLKQIRDPNFQAALALPEYRPAEVQDKSKKAHIAVVR